MKMKINDQKNNSETVLFFIDLDETLITREKQLILLEKNVIKSLHQLKNDGIFLFISSRNFPHAVKNALEELSIIELFHDYIADFRNKKYHIKEVISDLKLQNVSPTIIIFVDDHLPNCKNVAELIDEIDSKIYSIKYSKNPPHNLETITKKVAENNWSKLEKLSII
ncbi:MAG: HAD family hydrolase [Asgard group archaeon]|nr:HAD family hydrolase [Asgard group archaeon]